MALQKPYYIEVANGLYFSYNTGEIQLQGWGDRHTEIEKYDDGNDYVFIADLLEKIDSTGATISFECTYNEVAEDLEDEDKSNLKRVFSFNRHFGVQ